MEIQRTTYGQIRSVFETASIPNTDFGSITPNKFSNCSHWAESVWKDNTQHMAKLWQCLGFHRSQILVSICLGLIKSQKLD